VGKPVGKLVGKPVGKPEGKPVGKPVGIGPIWQLWQMAKPWHMMIIYY